MKKTIIFLTLITLLSACGGGKSTKKSSKPLPQGISNPNEIKALSNNFDNAESIKDWKILDKNKVGKLEVKNGQLLMAPSKEENIGWYEDLRGIFVYQNITGNFAITTKVKVGRINQPNSLPKGKFNSAGLLIRNPLSETGEENWVMYNIGFQYINLGRETKTTEDSSSVLQLMDTNVSSGKLLFCRVGRTIKMYHWLKDESSWVEENNPSEFTREDFPATLQVGLMLNASKDPADTLGQFDYIKLGVPKTLNDCTKVVK